MRGSDLETGEIYFVLVYEDSDLTRAMIESYEYLGMDLDGTPKEGEDLRYFFRLLGTDDTVVLNERQLEQVWNLPALIGELTTLSSGEAS